MGLTCPNTSKHEIRFVDETVASVEIASIQPYIFGELLKYYFCLHLLSLELAEFSIDVMLASQ